VRDRAAGFDALTPMLAERVSGRLGRECAVVFPALPREMLQDGYGSPRRRIDGNRENAVDRAMLAELAGRELLVYTGSIHPGSAADLEVALHATAEVQRRGYQVALVHAGTILPRYDAAAMARSAGLQAGGVAFLGYLPFRAIPSLLGRATAVLQPGPPTELKRMGLPSKLMAYLASGTPTITLASGFGELLEDRREALKTHTGDPAELADRVVEVLTDAELRERLGRGARTAAQRFFDPETNAATLINHYRASLPR